MLFGMTACGSNDTAKDNAVNDATEGNNTEQDRTGRNEDKDVYKRQVLKRRPCLSPYFFLPNCFKSQELKFSCVPSALVIVRA